MFNYDNFFEKSKNENQSERKNIFKLVDFSNVKNKMSSLQNMNMNLNLKY